MKQKWFKAKEYGWGWYPVTWQGWTVTLGYVLLAVLFAFTLDKDSPPEEIVFTFLLPVALLTATLIRIAYVTGEKPSWQWGKKKE